jgi:hypothetical protein
MSSNPTLLWERLQDKFYRNFEGYPMQWDISKLEDYIVASAPCGGAIAVCRNESKISLFRGPESSLTSILLYSGAGKLLRKIPWDNGPIKGLGWSEREHLIAVSENGTARYYYDFQGNFQQFSLGKMAEANHVVECRFYGQGFVARLANDRFVSITRYDEPHSRLLTDNPEIPQHGILCWHIIAPQPDAGRSLEVLVGTSRALIVLNPDIQQRELENGSHKVIGLAVSPNGEFIAYYTENGILGVMSGDFLTKLSEFNAKSAAANPKQIEWCGNDAVALVYDDEITLVGPWGGSLNLFFNDTVVVVPEMDGMRTLTSEKHDFFTKVPEKVVDIFRLGSTTPAAILRDCIEQFDRKSPKADENLLIISDRLPQAVDICVDAASLEFEPLWQKKLLRAASFGKSAIDLYNSDRYLQVSKYLRVLNSVRLFDVGILGSYTQLIHLGPQHLIDRLLLRRMHHLAKESAEFLGLPTEKIYVDWARTKVRVSQDDDEVLCKEIIARLSNVAGISYEEIAKAAFEEGRTDLAVVLTDREPRPDKQVPLLLEMQQDELALKEAIRSGDTDLVYYVLLTLCRKLPLATFFRLINDKPMATACFEQICLLQDHELLKNFYYQDDRRLESAFLKYNQALAEEDIGAMLGDLQETRKLFQEIKDRSFESRAIEEQAKLLSLQQQLEKDYDQPFIGFTITETISGLLKIAQNSRATKVKDEFKVPDKRFWWIKLQALASRRDWDSLHKFATSKKSPIGYEPFYDECLKAGSNRNAALYVSLCANLTYKQRIHMYVEVDDIRRAAEEAFKAKDVDILEGLRETSTSAIQAEIDDHIATLRRR